MVMPPAALIVSVIALIRGQDRARAIVGVVLSGLCVLFFFRMPLIMTLCR